MKYKNLINKYADDIEFDMPYKDIFKYINKKYPINTSNFESNIDYIVEKYPYISRLEVVNIINAFWISLRELLFSGKVITISKFINNFIVRIKFLSSSKTPFPYLIAILKKNK